VVVCSSVFIAADHAIGASSAGGHPEQTERERESAPIDERPAIDERPSSSDHTQTALVVESSSVTDFELKRCKDGLFTAGALRSVKGVVLGLQSYTQRRGRSGKSAVHASGQDDRTAHPGRGCMTSNCMGDDGAELLQLVRESWVAHCMHV
jgi:hypothetical protein